MEYLLRRPLVANLAVILVAIIGILTVFRLNRAGYPNVDFDIMKITTIYPGASAEDVEINVTKPIEDELKEVNGIDRMESTSLENISLIYVVIDTDAPDSDRVKDDVARAVDRGEATTGLGIHAAASAYGLSFVPLTKERYDFVLPESVWHSSAAQALVTVVRSSHFEEAVAALGGYDTSETGRETWIA